MNPKKIFFVILLVFGLITGVYLVTQTTLFKSRASSSSTRLPTKENSYLFASPIQAQADGLEKIRVTIFLLDSNGLGVSRQEVTLKVPSPIEVETLQSTTDDLGKATFNLFTSFPGKYEISASTSGFSLSQKINLLFL